MNGPSDDNSHNDSELADPLQIAFVKKRAAGYQLHIAARIELIDQLAEMLLIARRNYRENTSKT